MARAFPCGVADAGNPYGRSNEGKVEAAKSRRWFLLYRGFAFTLLVFVNEIGLASEGMKRIDGCGLQSVNSESTLTDELQHTFAGKWITDAEFAMKEPRPVNARQLQRDKLPPVDKKLCNRHILFRREFELASATNVCVFVTADDFYKLYMNGRFVGQGPAAGTPTHTYYNEIDVTPFVTTGRNVIAVHTYYQGLVNRVWVSGDNRHGLILDLEADGKTVVASDPSFRTARHRSYSVASGVTKGWPGARPGSVGYNTQFMERYDAGAAEVGFERADFDDSSWSPAVVHPRGGEYRLVPQTVPTVITEDVRPFLCENVSDGLWRIDFGAVYVGSLSFAANGPRGAEVLILSGQELNPDGSVRHLMRCNCDYVEQMVLSGEPRDVLVQFDYKSFRYTELHLPVGVVLDCDSIVLKARHRPFLLKAKPNFGEDPELAKIWRIAVGSFRWGVQEQIMDCMDREKGYYLGDGIYTMYSYCLLTGDWQPARNFIDDFLRTREIDRGLMTCANCSFMQEIAEYSLMLVQFTKMYLDATGDIAFVRSRYAALADVVDSYRERYARKEDGLLVNLDKWCVVEWPRNFQDGYDADIREGKVCSDVHNAINAWYVGAVKTLNMLAKTLGCQSYGDAESLEASFVRAFWDSERKLFVDRVGSRHISMPGNTYAAFFELMPKADRAAFKENFTRMAEEKFPDSVSFFQFPPLFSYLKREGELELVHKFLRHPGAWLRSLREGATRSIEGWGYDTKWNTSLYHLTMASVVMFLTDGE